MSGRDPGRRYVTPEHKVGSRTIPYSTAWLAGVLAMAAAFAAVSTEQWRLARDTVALVLRVAMLYLSNTSG